MKILVIEDEPGILRFLEQGLREEAYAVDVAEEGNKGLELALTENYDLLLIDWMIPGISGIEICRQFRKQDTQTPIIFLTARDTAQDVVFGLEMGANDYIKKPFDFEELLARIKVQLRPTSGEHQQFTLRDIVLDIEKHLVLKNGQEVSLTPKEFALLEFLIRNKNKVCRRTRIIESVWDIHWDYNSGVIDVYINSLRKKLGIEKDDSYIQTVRGVGYVAKD